MSARAASVAHVAARRAVGESVADLESGSTILIACSGGPDSLALAGVSAWVGARRGLVVHAVVVDHGLQVGSDETASWAAGVTLALGVDGAEVVTVEVGREGGPEAAARSARYEALERAAADRGAAGVLLGHTREDQAETVLLRLARGSGARSLAAMTQRAGLWRRPFLRLPRADVHAVAAQLLEPLGERSWADPHNADRGFARVRVRELLAGLEGDLGVGVVRGLARSADLLRDDADALDGYAQAALEEHVLDSAGESSCAVADLLALPRAVRTRVIRSMCLQCGCPADELDLDHVTRVEALVGAWHGQGEIRLPGGVVARRSCGRLCLRSQ